MSNSAMLAALLLKRRRASFRALPTPRIFSASFSSSSQNTMASPSRPPLLGLNLPDIWTLRKDKPPLPPRRERKNEESLNGFSVQTWDQHYKHWIPVSTEVVGKLDTTVIDGCSIAETMKLEIADEVRKMKASIGKVPGLAVVLVGSRKDSETYVHNKVKACHEVGIQSFKAELPENCTENEVYTVVSNFNKDPSVHGVLVQLPLPQHMDEENILGAIRIEKDVDGFHPLNMAHLAMRGREPVFVPCTPKACIELLIRYGIDIMGKRAVVIGRSNIVGLPTFLLLQRHHATVSIVHAFTENPEEVTREADIVVSAAGVANLVRRKWLKPGAVVIDVGTNPVEDPHSERGYRLVGDVCYEEALGLVSAITPVPGGVGPMTVAMLLSNTLLSARRAYGFC